MADLLQMSADIIDRADADPDALPGPINRINHELSVLTDRIAMVEAFSHCIAFRTDDGLLAFDTSNERGGPRVVQALRDWSREPFNTLVYTHGHIDHVGGCGAFIEDAGERGHPRPRVVGHENIATRFARYRLTNGYNQIINTRQFGSFSRRGYAMNDSEQFLPEWSPEPDLTYDDRLALNVGGLDIELRHARGETDDHSWTWIPEHRAICAGDFFIWNFPNAGNPQKVQRSPVEWAAALRAMAACDAELFLPAHGLPIAGQSRIRRVLGDVADALERLVNDTLAMMNDGARLNDIIHTVSVDPAELAKPYLQPLYDEPEFVVRNIWRLYGGWYDGNPAHLKPAREQALAAELATLAGGAGRLAERAETLADTDIRLACELVEFAVQAAGEDKGIHAIRERLYQRRRDDERSLMAKGVFGFAARQSAAIAAAPDDDR